MTRWPSLALLAPVLAQAAPTWVGPDCIISWRHNSVEEMVEGYSIHINRTDGVVFVVDQRLGYVNEVNCSTFQLEQGRYDVYVKAYNPVRESGPSETVPFVLVTSAPGTPAVTAPQDMSVVSAGGS